jgi:hypothetical protein
MSPVRAIASGFGRVLGSPGMVLALWLVNVAVALPLAWVLTASIEESIGPSLVHETMRDGFDVGWHAEYSATASGLETTFSPTVMGAGAFWNNLESWISGGLIRGFPGLVGVGALYLLLSVLLLGGVVARLAGQPEARGAAGFVRAGGRYFFRFLRLAALSGALYVLIYFGQRRVLGFLGEWTRDVTNEWTVLGFAMLAYGGTAFLLCLVHMVFSYAKIATVVDDRRSVLLAALRGLGFVARYPFRTFSLYYGVLLLGLVPLGLYAAVAPGAGQATPDDVAVAFAVGQAILIVRLIFRLALLGGETALYLAMAVPAPAGGPATSGQADPAPTAP